MGRGRLSRNAKKVQSDEIKLAVGRNPSLDQASTLKGILIRDVEANFTAPAVLGERDKSET